jgi:hypothetical protein
MLPYEIRLNEIDEKVFDEKYELFPKGNKQKTKDLLRHHILSQLDAKGNPVRFELIMSKWELYLSSQDVGKDQKYIKSMESFITAQDYNAVYDAEIEPDYIKLAKNKLKKYL